MTFRKYLKSIEREASPEGDFAEDALRDKSFPWKKANDLKDGKTSILWYLSRQRACREAVEAFSNVWRDYKRSAS